MHLEGHRKRKSSNEDSNNSVSKLTTPPNYGKTGSSSKCSNVFAVANLLGQLDEGKYGSVTKEYEALHPQRMQFINLLSTISPLRQSIAPLTAQGGTSIFSELAARKDQKNPHQSGNNLSCNVIDLEGDPLEGSANPVKDLAEHTEEACTVVRKDSSPTNEEQKEQAEVIVLDSDEEDVSHQIRNNHDFRPSQDASALRSLLTSEIQKHISRASKLAQAANSFQLVPYCQGMDGSDAVTSFKSNWQPSIQYEKVVLQTVQQEQRFQHVVDENSVQIRIDRDGEAPSTVMNVFPIHNAKRKEHQRKEHQRKEHLAGPKSGSAMAVQENSCMAVQHSSHRAVLENSSMPVQENSSMPMQENSSMPMQENSCLGDFDEDDKASTKSDGLDDLWKDMSLAMECSKVDTPDDPAIVQEEEEEEECNHSYMLQDDFGLVCRICGVIQKSIDTIFDFQWTKGSRSIRTYLSTSRSSKDLDETIEYSGLQVSEDDFVDADVSIHPRHSKQMKPHQFDGFNFLVKNLVTDKPGGCILAHAPGSGKTFMLISFLQSFLAKYPSKKPLVVLPKGILPIWKKELQRWQVEDLPVYDFYSFKADSRSQQLEVLKLWQEKKSILFLGYKQFSNIISDKENSKASAACREILLKVPGLLILDEGHTPRNEETYMLDSLAKVQTPRKVVLSGTLFQNHVREVFNILNLVRPKFLKMEHSRAIVKRVLSRVHISGGRKLTKSSADNAFYELVEETLQSDENFRRKVTVIQDLRELTKDVLHYYKGDFLEELPGLTDFTVLLNLSGKQKAMVQKLTKYEKFKRTSLASAVYMHPDLYEIAEKAPAHRATVTSFKDDKIDRLLGSINPRDGVKAKFFLNILSLAECAGEKLLAFSHYLLPLRFLERLMVKTKGWHTGREIFMICGDSSAEERERYMEQYNNSPDAKVFLGSIKACGEGISLVGASRVVILDVHLNPSVTRQAIGRAFRPGQLKKVYTYRLVAADSPEEEDHNTSFSKELTSKMWFEWTEYHKHQDFSLDEVSSTTCEDVFLESPLLGEDIKAVYKR